ncbi:MAG TPA: hypothetical protein ENO08_03735 [Candidatus Eisenbacteria bacterium]|uniref:Uncharacterized protein n=1 Tax=Eiseniibacteriota bacterium TaxID=2212470 RepID=A0A7V2F365_UNCEI|nr:hypothetical protein [Candidatus Eisenbacteria bacterium]
MSNAIRNQVVVRYRDGTLKKGYTHDFTPLRDSFHLTLEDGSVEILTVDVSQLKAIFFVKSFDGDRKYIEKKFFEQVDQSRFRGLKIRVVFNDGEIIRGISLGYNEKKKGFFLIPVDPDCNNDRIYIITGACKDIKVGEIAQV